MCDWKINNIWSVFFCLCFKSLKTKLGQVRVNREESKIPNSVFTDSYRDELGGIQ